MSEQNPSTVVDDKPQPTAAEIEARVRAEMTGQFEEEKNKILGNKEQILEEKRALEAKLKGVNDEELEQFRDFQKRLEKDAMLKMAADGDFEGLSHKLISSREKAWNETQAEYEERLKASQSESERLNAELQQLQQKNTTMQKRQFFKDLTGGDDSFKADYFNDYFELNANKADIDAETGSVYVLDDNNRRMVDTNGDFVKFEDYYSKQKINHGLFWSGGSGSGHRTSPGGGEFKKIKDMSSEEKNELRKQLGDVEYANMLRAQAK